MSSYKIYIIDDDPTTYDVLKDYLLLAGFEVETAEDGKAGLELILSAPPDLVLLDVEMPEMDGFQLLDSLRKTRAGRDIPVLYLTSLKRTNLKVKGLELGAEDYITKPFERAELFARIKGALRRGSRYQRLERTLTGNLADISLAELLQTLDIGRKTAHIKLPEMQGTIFVEQGLLSLVKQGSYSGEDAMKRLLLLEKGTFSVDFDVPWSEKSDESLGIQQQLMSCTAHLDEIVLALADIPEKNPLVEKILVDPVPVEIERFVTLLPLRLHELLALMPGDLLANAALLVKTLK